MKILQFCKKLPYPPKDGESIAILNFSKAYAELGHSVTVFAINTNRHYFDPAQIPSSLQEKIRFETIELNTSPSIMGALNNLLFSSESYHVNRFYDNRVVEKLSDLLEEEYDVVQVEGLFGLQYQETIKQHSGGILAYRSHNIEYQIWERLASNERNPLKKRYLQIQVKRLRKFEQNHWSYPDCIIPISSVDEETIVKNHPSAPVKTIPASIIAQDWIVEDNGKRQIRIGFLGALDWLPNQEGLQWFMDQVWPYVQKGLPECSLQIAGRNLPDWMHQWENDSVDILGEVDSAVDFMSSCDLMIVPLFSGSGMRIKIIEAMSAGKTVIATSIAAEGIQAESGKHLIISNTAEDFIRQCKRLLTDDTLRNEIGRNAQSFVREHFDYITLSKKLLDFYSSLPK